MPKHQLSVISSETKITTDPFPGAQKVYEPGHLFPEIRVPMRTIALTDGSDFRVYDTSGPSGICSMPRSPRTISSPSNRLRRLTPYTNTVGR